MEQVAQRHLSRRKLFGGEDAEGRRWEEDMGLYLVKFSFDVYVFPCDHDTLPSLPNLGCLMHLLAGATGAS